MKLKQSHIDKTDPYLQKALVQAEDEQDLRAVMILGPEDRDVEQSQVTQELTPSQFSSRKSYRQALIEQRQSQLSDDIGQTLRALQDLSLTPQGGQTTQVVVVEGSARQILTSLDLPGVRHASLDRQTELNEPHYRGPEESEE